VTLSTTARAVVVDVRNTTAHGPVETVDRLTTIGTHLVEAFAELRTGDEPAALVVRHTPAPSGRLSGSLLGEIVVASCRSFVRQLRYDRSWVDTPISFVDARDATDDEVAAVVESALAGRTPVAVERTTGRTAAYGWERGDGL
jgi:hypothetical protein